MLNVALEETGICPLCRDGAKKKLLFRLNRTNVYVCACGLKFIDPSLTAETMMTIYTSSEFLREINPALENYYEYETLDAKSTTFRDYARALDHVSRYAKGRNLLEVGCGTGGFLEFAREKGWSVFGVDSSTENIAKLRSRGIAGECANFVDFFSEMRFDVMVLWDLIEHPQDPLSFIGKSYELLKPGGVLLLATPYDPNLLTLLAGTIYRFSFGKIKFAVEKLYFLEHTSYFNLRTLSNLLQKGCFKVIRFWKTETDLDRYRFSRSLKWVLKIAFLFARLFRLQNRIILLAQKDNQSDDSVSNANLRNQKLR